MDLIPLYLKKLYYSRTVLFVWFIWSNVWQHIIVLSLFCYFVVILLLFLINCYTYFIVPISRSSTSKIVEIVRPNVMTEVQILTPLTLCVFMIVFSFRLSIKNIYNIKKKTFVSHLHQIVDIISIYRVTILSYPYPAHRHICLYYSILCPKQTPHKF